MMAVDPKKRIKIEDIYEDSWVANETPIIKLDKAKMKIQKIQNAMLKLRAVVSLKKKQK